MISCHDQRPTNEIVDYLMVTPENDIDLLSVVTILCKRIDALEVQNEKLKKEIYIAGNTASCLANGIIPD